MTRRLDGRNLFTLFIAVVFAGALVVAWDWPLRASVIVLVLGTVGLALSLAQLAIDMRKSAAEAAAAARPTYETPTFEAEDPKLSSRQTYQTWAWLVGLVVAVPIVGLPVALTLFVFLYCKLHGGGWPMSLALSGGVAAFVWGIYVQIMHVYWPGSLLGALLRDWIEI